MCVCSCNYPACSAHALCQNSGYLWPVRLHRIFSTLSHKLQGFRKRVIEHEMCVWIFSIVLSETFLILRRTERDIITNIGTCSSKVTVILCQILKRNLFLNRFAKNTQILNLIKIGPVGSELLHADRQTDRLADMMKLIFVLRSFAKAPKNGRSINLNTRLPFNVNLNA